MKNLKIIKKRVNIKIIVIKDYYLNKISIYTLTNQYLIMTNGYDYITNNKIKNIILKTNFLNSL